MATFVPNISSDLVTPGDGVMCKMDSFLPFVSDGEVSLVGSDEKVSVKILRDTAAFDYFIQASVMPFSELSATGCSVPVLGMKVLQIPMHYVMLCSDLFQGQVSVGVRPALPIEGIIFILGNGVAGSKVWADKRQPLVSSVPLVRNQPDDSELCFPDVFTACAVTRSMRRTEEDSVLEGQVTELTGFSLSDLPLTFSQEDLKLEQKADHSLDVVFEQVHSPEEVKNSSQGYFLHNGLLLRKWLPYNDRFVGDPVVQVVLPDKFRTSVLKLTHDDAGHWGVRKTYDYILQHFFWPHFKKRCGCLY